MTAFYPPGPLSLSARRAWIEILTTVLHWYHINVALRKESVDRNTCWTSTTPSRAPSLSARRAWIEMSCICPTRLRPTVALRKESVDRNQSPLSLDPVDIVALRKESVDRNREYCSNT